MLSRTPKTVGCLKFTKQSKSGCASEANQLRGYILVGFNLTTIIICRIFRLWISEFWRFFVLQVSITSQHYLALCIPHQIRWLTECCSVFSLWLSHLRFLKLCALFVSVYRSVSQALAYIFIVQLSPWAKNQKPKTLAQFGCRMRECR